LIVESKFTAVSRYELFNKGVPIVFLAATGFLSKSETEVYLEVRIKSITPIILCTSYRSRLGLDEAASTVAGDIVK
jgi:hypothetical protein